MCVVTPELIALAKAKGACGAVDRIEIGTPILDLHPDHLWWADANGLFTADELAAIPQPDCVVFGAIPITAHNGDGYGYGYGYGHGYGYGDGDGYGDGEGATT